MNSNWLLNPGDIIDVIAPSSGIPINQINSYIKKVSEIINSIGFTARIDKNIISPNKDPFSANTKEFRYQSFKKAIFDENSKAVWCIRGGYGAAHLIDELNLLPAPPIPKILLGFSDITALHLFVNNKWNWDSLHCKVLWQYISSKKDNVSLNMISDILRGNKNLLKYQLYPLNRLSKQKNINIKAKITGGNLAVIQTSIGTCWQINSQNKIIFFEDCDERGYSVDRILNHFKQANIFNQACAIIFGDFTYKTSDKEKYLIEIAINRFASSSNIPIYRIKGIGHDEVNYPLPLNVLAKISLDKDSYFLEYNLKP